MTALSDREIRLARAVHRAAINLRGEIECMPAPEDQTEGEREIITDMDAELADYVALLAEIGVSINGPFALPPLPADYWVGNT